MKPSKIVGLHKFYTQLLKNRALEENVKYGKQFLYALNGAWFLTESYKYLKDRNLDMMVIDATCGDYVGDYRMGEHNSIPMLRLMLPSLKTWGVINDGTKVYMTHLAPRLHLPHEETVALPANGGLIPSA